jgi:dUTPase
MKVKYYIKNAYGMALPKRANETDAGYDIVATSGPNIVGDKVIDDFYRRIDYIEFETNLYICPSTSITPFTGTTNFHTDLRPRSSVSKYDLVLANSIGLIDRGYKNQILVRFNYIWQPDNYKKLKEYPDDLFFGKPNLDKIYKKGDKIAQLLPMVTHDVEFEIVEELPGSDRGGGFGSSGK